MNFEEEEEPFVEIKRKAIMYLNENLHNAQQNSQP